MKKNTFVFCLLFIVTVAQAQFEGEIDMKIANGKGETKREANLTMFMKNGMLAFTVKGEENVDGNIVFRSDKNVLWIISNTNKSYIEIVPEDEGSSKDKSSGKSSQKSPGKVKGSFHKTGKTQTILGYVCEEWVAEEQGKVTDIWGTAKLGNVYEGFTKAFGRWGKFHQEEEMKYWQDELIKNKIFPMMTEVKENDEVSEMQEVTKVEPKSLSSSLFEPPADYKKQSLGVDIGKMMKGLKEGTKKGDVQPMSKEDIEKLMKQLKENMKENRDSTQKKDDDDDDDNE